MSHTLVNTKVKKTGRGNSFLLPVDKVRLCGKANIGNSAAGRASPL